MSKRSSRRLGKLFFFVPVVVVIAIVVLGVISLAGSQTGTLIVTAVSSDRYSTSVVLHPTISIGSTVATSPSNFTFPQGMYTVVYGPVAWFATPPPRSILVAGGRTEYATGIYNPIIRYVGITANGFNVTSFTILHAVTPVAWINLGNSAVVIDVSGIRRISLGPSQNLTLVFSASGSFVFDIPNTQFTGTVHST